MAPKKAGKAIKVRPGETRLVAGNLKMGPEELQEHLKLKSRARTIPDKKKKNDRRACRNSRQALRGFRVRHPSRAPERLVPEGIGYEQPLHQRDQRTQQNQEHQGVSGDLRPEVQELPRTGQQQATGDHHGTDCDRPDTPM